VPKQTRKSNVKCSVLCLIRNLDMEIFVLARFLYLPVVLLKTGDPS
jgi:hypothetical protein